MIYRGDQRADNDIVILAFFFNDVRVDTPAKLLAIDVTNGPRAGWSQVAVNNQIVHVRPEQVLKMSEYFALRKAGQLPVAAIGRLSFEPKLEGVKADD